MLFRSYAEMEEMLRRIPHSLDADLPPTKMFAHIFVCSYAEMKEMLRRIPHSLDADLPPTKMFETAKMVLVSFFY